MAFHSNNDPRYYDADVTKQISFDSQWAINEVDADDQANEMHETVVTEIMTRIENGECFVNSED